MTDIATNTSHDSAELTMDVKTSGNKEIDEVLLEIAELKKLVLFTQYFFFRWLIGYIAKILCCGLEIKVFLNN